MSRQLKKPILVATATCLLLVSICCLAGANERQRIQSLSTRERSELQQKVDRFRSLSDQDKRRFRSLHNQIAKQKDSDRLNGVLGRYYQWLKTLPAAKRAELAAMSDQERMAAIKRLREREHEQSFRTAMRNQLSHEDSRIIFNFLREYVSENQSIFLKRLPEPTVKRLDRMTNPVLRKRAMVMALSYHRDSVELPIPSAEDFQILLSQLTEPTRQRVGPVIRDPENHREEIEKWMTSALTALARPPIQEGQIMKFFNELPEDRKQKLEKLPRDQMLRELRRQFNAKRQQERRDAMRDKRKSLGDRRQRD